MVTVDGDQAEFRFFRPSAQTVFLTGDFNNWEQTSLPMVRTTDGYWSAKLHLPAGEFKFRYYADDEWFADYAAFGLEPGMYGWDSLCRVPDQPLKIAAPVGGDTAAVAAA